MCFEPASSQAPPHTTMRRVPVASNPSVYCRPDEWQKSGVNSQQQNSWQKKKDCRIENGPPVLFSISWVLAPRVLLLLGEVRQECPRRRAGRPTVRPCPSNLCSDPAPSPPSRPLLCPTARRTGRRRQRRRRASSMKKNALSVVKTLWSSEKEEEEKNALEVCGSEKETCLPTGADPGIKYRGLEFLLPRAPKVLSTLFLH